MNKLNTLVLFIFLCLPALSSANSIWLGEWHGSAKTKTEDTRLNLKIVKSNDQLSASISLNDVGVSGWPVSAISATKNTLHVEIPSDSGVQKMDFELHNGALTGTWLEPNNDEHAIVNLQKVKSFERSSEKRVLIDGPAGKIAASIFTPIKEDPVPAIVFLHGSGPQPRDANRFAALRFAELGIASIIYDKRGVGESEGKLEGVSFEDLAADAIAVAEYMMSHTSVSKIGFSGHSQGGWVATLAASNWANTAFVITSSGPAVSPAREAHWTVVRAMRKNGASKEAIREARSVIENWHEGVRTGNWAAFEKLYVLAEKKSWFKNSELIYFSEKPSAQDTHSYRAFIDYDPIPAIKALKMPYLAILSPQDESIDAVETKEILEALAIPNISLRFYPGYDHSMRKLDENSKRLRWPEHPEGYYENQAEFINSVEM